MDETAKLIEQAKTDSAEAKEAVSLLAAKGLPVVREIIDAMRDTTPYKSMNLGAALRQMPDRRIVPLMIDCLNEENTYLQVTAFKVLASFKDKRALKPVLAQLTNRGNFSFARAWAADTLGDIGDPKVIPALIEAANEIANSKELEDVYGLLLSLVKALAKLGNQQMAHAAISLANNKESEIRRDAVGVLKYLAGPGLLSTLAKASRDDDPETRWDAVEALCYLGVREAIEALIECVEDENEGVRNFAINRLNYVTGEDFDEEITIRKARQWWRGNEAEFASRVCYRLGKPLRLINIINLLKDEPRWRNQIIDELLIITGNDFGLTGKYFDMKKKFYPIVYRWWKKQKRSRFKTARLYKYGYEQEIEKIYEP
jgi:HEAT repeat protein